MSFADLKNELAEISRFSVKLMNCYLYLRMRRYKYTP